MRFNFKKLVLATAFITSSSLTLASPVLVKTEHNIYEYVLDNGLKIVLAPNAKENKVYMNTIYFTGSLNDPEGKGGLAHLLEHLAFKGTKDVQGEEFQRLLDQYTLSNNASTSYYSTRYTNIVRPEKTAIDKILYLEAQRMDKLVLQEKFVPTEIEIVRREREIRLDQPFSVMIDEVWKSAYGNQYLGRLPIGDLNELISIKMPELEKFYKTYYVPNNAVMVLAGKFEVNDVIKSIDQYYSSIQPRDLPQPVQVPLLDSSKITKREFSVQKGSDLAKFNIYLGGANNQIQPSLALIPALYSMEPSGQLYNSMVKTGITTAVLSTTWMEKDFNLILLGAVYSPQQNEKEVATRLVNDVETKIEFTENELNRVKSIAKNTLNKMMTDSVAVGTALSDYVVTYQGNWAKFFEDQNIVQNLELNVLQKTLKDFLTPEQRLMGNISPTPEDQKNAQKKIEQAKTLDQGEVTQEILKDPKVYREEIKQYVKASSKLLKESEANITRGKLSNGLKYAIYPVNTRDDRIYATIKIDFGDEKSLFNKAHTIELMTYLLLRGSEQYSLQEIMDKSIELDGSAVTKNNKNSISVNISAKKENFNAYFNFIIDVLKHPKFDQKEFDLIKSQSLQSLDRPYTEPDTVSELTMGRLLEQYEEGDLRYHFEPELAKQQIEQLTNEQIKELYQKFFAMNHAQIAITGDVANLNIPQLLQEKFSGWNSTQNYQPILPHYQQLKAKKVHALAEQREFGYYQSVLMLPISIDHVDAPAVLVLSHILGESQLSSRLAKELREKKALVYGFGQNLTLNSQADVGALMIGANYTAGRADQVSQAIHKVLSDLIQHGVTEQELEAAKMDIMKSRVTLMEDERNIHRMLISQLEYDKSMQDREKRDQAISSLSIQDINRVIKKYIKVDQLIEVSADQFAQKSD